MEKRPEAFPSAYLLGGQPGAGKSRLQKLILKNDPNTIIINADAYREYHPYFNFLQSEYGDKSPTYTQPFINQVTEKLVDDLSNESYNLVIEGTLRSASVPIGTCDNLKQKKYHVNLYIMSVKPEISFESTILRYEYALGKGEIPRATDKNHHDMVVNSMVQNIKVIEESNCFEAICLFDRFGNCIYDSNISSVSACLKEKQILHGKWTRLEFDELQRIIFEISDLKQLRHADDLEAYRDRANNQLRIIRRMITKDQCR